MKKRNILCMGDSMTEAGIWPARLAEKLQCNVHCHCKGGLGMLEIVDGGVGAEGNLAPLSSELVRPMDLIIFYAGYNNRGIPDGIPGECYSPENNTGITIAGMMQYCINRIYEELRKAENLSCRLLIVTPHCAGRYPYIDADGYGEFPAGTGRTMESLSGRMKEVAQRNNIAVCDLWHNSGINKYTWSIYGTCREEANENYSPFLLDPLGNPVSMERVSYERGKTYYQKRNGAVVLEEYTDITPYPYNGDQLHCSREGYYLIGDLIAGVVKKMFGE
ncbi:MAG: SGNH/GDSL hydrolase family protein [Anaerocolumna jejuensis]